MGRLQSLEKMTPKKAIFSTVLSKIVACSGKEIYHFCFVFLCIRGQIRSKSPPGACIRKGDLTEGFLRYEFGGLIFGGAYTWRGLFSEFYGIRITAHVSMISSGLTINSYFFYRSLM